MPVDVAFEVAGDDDAIADAVAAVRPGGRVVLVGIPDGDRSSFPAAAARRKELSLQLCRRMAETDLPRAIALAEAGRVDLSALITHRYPARPGLGGVRHAGVAARPQGRREPAHRRLRTGRDDRPRYTIGVDFGTESGRAVLVDVADGREVGIEVEPYRNGVIDARLPAPDEDVVLGPDWALQDPDDYLEVFRGAVRRLVAGSGVDPAQVIGIGIDFTACTMLPTTSDGTPLCFLDAYRRDPHAWVKLWKHHAAQPEADTSTASRASSTSRGSPRYGGKISSEWFFPKALQILREAPDVYRAADRLVEAADWVVWQLTGRETRNNCTAGYKALWSAADGFPDSRFFEALEPGFGSVVDDKMSPDDRADRRSRRRPDRAGGRLDRPPAGHGGRGRQRRRPRLGPGGDRHRTRHAGRDHGDEHLPRRPRGDGAGDRRDVRRGRRRRDPGVLRLRGGPGGRRRHLRVVRRRSRAAAVPRPGTKPGRRASTRSWPRRRRRSGRESRGCSRSIGGTATGPCWSMPTCRACWSG